jgi:ATPase involved in DNA repair
LKRFRHSAKKVSFFDETLQELQKQITACASQLNIKAQALTDSRKAAFNHITTSIEAQLHELGIPNAVLAISHEIKEQFGSTGRDEISFLFAAIKTESRHPSIR